MANEKFILPLFYKELNDATNSWSDEEFGAYVRLLIYQWSNNEIPKEMSRLKRIAESAEKNWGLLGKKFSPTETGFQNNVMEVIRFEKQEFNKKQLNNGSKGGNPLFKKGEKNPYYAKDNPKITSDGVIFSENGDESENIAQKITQHNPKDNPKDNPSHNPEDNPFSLPFSSPSTPPSFSNEKIISEKNIFELKNAFTMKQETGRLLKTTTAVVDTYLDDFFQEQLATGGMERDLKDIRKHFVKWAQIHHKKKSQETSKQKHVPPSPKLIT